VRQRLRGGAPCEAAAGGRQLLECPTLEVGRSFSNPEELERGAGILSLSLSLSAALLEHMQVVYVCVCARARAYLFV
jgi:hypothetical protein